MAELLTHVAVTYVGATIITWRINRLDNRWVPVAMIGAVLPDLNKLDWIIGAYRVEAAVGLPFDWDGLHTLGGAVLLAGGGAVLFQHTRDQYLAWGCLTAGAGGHLVVDSVKQWADGAGDMYLYPLSWWRPPTPGWYVTADRWVLVVSVLLASVVFIYDQHRNTAG